MRFKTIFYIIFTLAILGNLFLFYIVFDKINKLIKKTVFISQEVEKINEIKNKVILIPISEAKEIIKSRKAEKLNISRIITGYTSSVNETDSSPCISADNTNICKVNYNVCASNFVPFNTKLKIEGLGICVVKDRINKKYNDRVDWYFGKDKNKAIRFGKKYLKVEVL
mgnify:CR=1 FL=1